MKVSDRIVDIIEDHVMMQQTLAAINYAIDNNLPMPSIPILNDTLTTDMFCKICEALNKSRPIRSLSDEEIKELLSKRYE